MASKGNVNEEGYQRRLDVVNNILRDHDLIPASVETLAYDVRCPFHFNNFIYKATLSSPATTGSSKLLGKQPGTFALPKDGTSVLVVRLSNPRAEGLNNANRVENEVASQYLARRLLQKENRPLIVPAIYAWGPSRFDEEPDEAGFGWTILEFMYGSELDVVFPDLPLEEKALVVRQIVDSFVSIQKAPLPESVTHFGGLTFDENGRIIIGQMALLSGGPWDTYSDLWTAKLMAQLHDSEKSPLLQGWKAGGISERLKSFLTNSGVGRVLGSDEGIGKVLIHGDLTMNNMLYDTEKKRLTAILDFDWAAVTHPCDEFLSGFWDLGGGIHEENASFQECVMTGDFSSTITPSDVPSEDMGKWEIGKLLNAALAQRGAMRPSNLEAARAIRKLRELENMLCPFALSNEVMLRRQSEEAKQEGKAHKGQEILRWLAGAGF